MIRQRIRARTSSTGGLVGRFLVGLLALALVWYGLMLVLLAGKVDPALVDSISGYRTVFDYLAGLTAGDLDPATRAIIAGAGVLAFLFFGFLALRALPRPYLARHDLTLSGNTGEEVVVEARALERVAEVAARELGAVETARARAGVERIEIDVGLSRAEEIGNDLAEVRSRVRSSLELHGIPPRPIDVTLTSFDQPQRRRVL